MCLTCNKNLDPTQTKTIRDKFASEAGGRVDKIRLNIKLFLINRKKLKTNNDLEYTEDFIDAFEKETNDHIEEILIVLGLLLPTPWYLIYQNSVISKIRARVMTDLKYSKKAIDSTLFTSLKSKPLLQKQLTTYIKKAGYDAVANLTNIVTQGVLKNTPFKVLYAQINDEMKKIKNRMKTIVRTETIRTSAETALDLYEAHGLSSVTGMAEFTTAGDNVVCSICSSLDKRVFTIAEARGIIPIHPNCRCFFLPYIEKN